MTALALSTSTVGPAAGAMREAPGLDTGDARDPPDAPDAADPDDADLDASLPIDREQVDAHDAASALGRGLALALGEMRPLSATFLAATWSLSDDGLRRLAIAHALEWAFPLVGDALVIEHLSYDGDPAIRAAAARAAWARRQAGGDLSVLARLSHDPDPQVRSIASSARSA